MDVAYGSYGNYDRHLMRTFRMGQRLKEIFYEQRKKKTFRPKKDD